MNEGESPRLWYCSTFMYPIQSVVVSHWTYATPRHDNRWEQCSLGRVLEEISGARERDGSKVWLHYDYDNFLSRMMALMPAGESFVQECNIRSFLSSRLTVLLCSTDIACAFFSSA